MSWWGLEWIISDAGFCHPIMIMTHSWTILCREIYGVLWWSVAQLLRPIFIMESSDFCPAVLPPMNFFIKHISDKLCSSKSCKIGFLNKRTTILCALFVVHNQSHLVVMASSVFWSTLTNISYLAYQNWL